MLQLEAALIGKEFSWRIKALFDGSYKEVVAQYVAIDLRRIRDLHSVAQIPRKYEDEQKYMAPWAGPIERARPFKVQK